MATKKRDSDKKMTYLVCGLFTAALLAVDIILGRWSEMSAIILVGIVLLHVFFTYTWSKVIDTMDDPDNKWRWANIIGAVICIAAVMFHRADRVGDEMFRDDVEKNKTENAAP